jgi:pyruvate/2-oxoglutarate dehydrogenase complex dihydrolipoamide dehydrogenase (E3) component
MIAAPESPETLRAEGIAAVLGQARFVAPGRIEIDGQLVTGRRFVIATGTARPSRPSQDCPRWRT